MLYNAAGLNPSTRTSDVVVAEIDSAGTWQWATQGGGAGNEYIGPVYSQGGRLYVTGVFNSSSVFGTIYNPSTGPSDLMVAKLDTAGSWQWVFRAGGPGNDYARILGFDSQGRLHVAGGFDGASINLPPFTLAAQPVTTNYTLFVARLSGGALLSAGPPPSAASAFDVWPNPTTGTVHIGGVRAGERVELFDVLGRAVGMGGAMPAAGSLVLALPAGLARGVYVVRAGARARRLVVE